MVTLVRNTSRSSNSGASPQPVISSAFQASCPAGESVSPYARVCGRVDWIFTYPDLLSKSEVIPNPARSLSDSRAVALVTEPAHQLGPGPGHPGAVPAGVAGGAGEGVPGNRRHHDVEGVRRVPATRPRVGQRPDHVEELDDRGRPAVREDQRQGVRLR